MSSKWSKILNWVRIEDEVDRLINKKLDDRIKEEAIKIFESKFSELEDIFQMEVEDIENSIIEVIVKDIFDKNIELESENRESGLETEVDSDEILLKELKNQLGDIPELQYIQSFIEQNPQFKEMLKKEQKRRKLDEDKSNMFI